ncbi:MAG: hypothetical protein ACSHYF_18095 [Verrucomicrobiaceae bacterium]
MKFASPALGLTLLAAAAGVGVLKHGEEQTTTTGSSSGPLPAHHVSTRHPAPSRPGTYTSHPALTEEENTLVRIALKQVGQQLDTFDEELHLTSKQRRSLLPLLIRTHLDYSPYLPFPTGKHGRFELLGPPLNAADFEAGLASLLSPDQSLIRAAEHAERDAWWTSIISRLEDDLPREELSDQSPPSSSPAGSRNLNDLLGQ